MDINDVIQWVTVAVIIVIAIVVIGRKARGLRKSINGDEQPHCGCGCAGCEKKCDLGHEERNAAGKNKKRNNKN